MHVTTLLLFSVVALLAIGAHAVKLLRRRAVLLLLAGSLVLYRRTTA
jgi:hypothetical protein